MFAPRLSLAAQREMIILNLMGRGLRELKGEPPPPLAPLAPAPLLNPPLSRALKSAEVEYGM